MVRKNLNITPDQITAHKNLVSQFTKLFGVRHFDRYDFLLAVSNKLGDIGLEHHRRPADMNVKDYRTPTSGNLLWVYEGQTNFWTLVAAARAGLVSEPWLK